MTNGFPPFYLGRSSRRKWRRGGGANNRLPPSPSRAEQEEIYRKWRGHSGVNIMGGLLSSRFSYERCESQMDGRARVLYVCVRLCRVSLSPHLALPNTIPTHIRIPIHNGGLPHPSLSPSSSLPIRKKKGCAQNGVGLLPHTPNRPFAGRESNMFYRRGEAKHICMRGYRAKKREARPDR